jgi:hypothetical protein
MIWGVRSPVDLLDLPFVFSQLGLLTTSGFIGEAKERGVRLTAPQLEGLHRFRLLPPLLRVSRDGRAIAQHRDANPVLARQLAHWQPTSAESLGQARDAGRLYAAADEGFVARRRMTRKLGDCEYRTSSFLYSPHQLLSLPTLAPALTHLKYSPDAREVIGLEVHRSWLAFAREQATQHTAIVIALSALEPVYYPQVLGTLSLGHEAQFDEYEDWRRELPLRATLDWLGVEPTWLKDTATRLLSDADSFDPLGDWIELVREAHPERWSRLKGTARNAIDFRMAAEILLRYYEDLARESHASPLEPPPSRWRHQLHGRLKPQRGIDRLLTSYGLSPHPSLILVVEGDTELLIFPRLMEMLSVRQDEAFISIQNAEGVDKDINALISFAIAPRFEKESDGHLGLLRPATRILVAADAEGKLATQEQRARRRAVWVERILRTFPAAEHTPSVRAAIDRLVYLETWDLRGQSFEFAHFTDRQLAGAIRGVLGPSAPPHADVIKRVASVRSKGGNLKVLLQGRSKLALADELWAVLERKVVRAQEHETELRIPIVRVLDRAIELARELPRRNVVIPVSGL